MLRSACILLILTSLTSTTQGLARVLLSPENSVAKVGNLLYLPCVIYADSELEGGSGSPLTLSWKKGDTVLKNGSNIIIHETTAVNSSNGETFTLIKSVLELCNVRSEDAGQYSCIAGRGREEHDSATFNVQVLTTPVRVLVATTDEDLRVNNSIYLICVGFGLPLPQVTWMHNGRPLTNDATSTIIHNDVIERGGHLFVRSTLLLCNVRGEVNGEYTCVARNEVTSSDHTSIVTVPTPLVFHSAPEPTQPHTLVHGQSANYTCNFLGYPFPTVVWTRNTSANPISTLGRFAIHTYQVSVNGLYVTRSVLEITAASEKLEGTFNCSARNNFSDFTLTSTFVIDVVLPPQIVISPVRQMKMVATPTSRKATFVMCVALGSPRPSLEWRNGAVNLHNSSHVTITETVETYGEGRELIRSQLEICGPETFPVTEYSCIATNRYGNTVASNSSSFHICTIDEVEFLLVPYDETADKGGSIFIPCVAVSVASESSASISWSRRKPGISQPRGESEELTNGTDRVTIYSTKKQRENGVVIIKSILHLGCLELKDAGRYSCHATNAAINKTADFLLNVKVTPIKVGPDGGIEQKSEQLNHGGYAGPLITNVFLVVVIFIHLAFRKLRMSKICIPFVNLCSTLLALNFSYITSLVSAHNPGMTVGGCGFLAAVFHYLFLAGSFAFAVMVTFVLTDRTKWSKRNNIIFYLVVFLTNWGLPLLLVILSAAPKVSNYNSGLLNFCGPTGLSLWLGLAAPVGVVHFVTFTALILLSFLSKKVQEYTKQREVLGIAIILTLFDVIWGMGLSSIILTTDNPQKTALQDMFTTVSAFYGLGVAFFFCFLSKNVRQEFIKLFCRNKAMAESTAVEEGIPGGLQVDSFKQKEECQVSAQMPPYLYRKMSAGSISQSSLSPGAESVEQYSAHFRTLDPILEHQNG